MDSKSHDVRIRPQWSNSAKKIKRKMTQKDIFGEENEAPGPAVVEVQGSASENSSTSEDDDERRKGTAPSRKRLTMLQKHFEKNRMTQKELGE